MAKHDSSRQPNRHRRVHPQLGLSGHLESVCGVDRILPKGKAQALSNSFESTRNGLLSRRHVGREQASGRAAFAHRPNCVLVLSASSKLSLEAGEDGQEHQSAHRTGAQHDSLRAP